MKKPSIITNVIITWKNLFHKFNSLIACLWKSHKTILIIVTLEMTNKLVSHEAIRKWELMTREMYLKGLGEAWRPIKKISWSFC